MLNYNNYTAVLKLISDLHFNLGKFKVVYKLLNCTQLLVSFLNKLFLITFFLQQQFCPP